MDETGRWAVRLLGIQREDHPLRDNGLFGGQSGNPVAFQMMFASLFPLAPLLALIIGLGDLRIDANRLLWFNRKPVPSSASGIGIWLQILSYLQYFSVMTNAFISQFPQFFFILFQSLLPPIFAPISTAKPAPSKRGSSL